VFDLTFGKQAPSKGRASKLLDDSASVTELNLLSIVTDLSCFATKIIPATPIDDYCFIMTPFSFSLVRIEKNRVNEIMTSSAATAIAENFSTDPNKPFERPESKTEKSVLNFTSKELKLDSTTRVVPLPGNRLLVCDEKTEWQVLAIKFDQADLDVADVTFTPVVCDERITPSRVVAIWRNQQEQSEGQANL